MRFMLLVKATGCSEAGVPHSPEHRFAKEAILASMAEAGVLLAAERLQPSSGGIRMAFSPEGEPELESGPFPADSWLLAEYLVIESESVEEAIGWARRIPAPGGCERMEVELRRLEDKAAGPRNIGLENDLALQLGMLRQD
ncbi:YciI family protein [Cohnella sp.]|uniref:YciI family protein n=1 Tax=Cohnella sp. TaxID=1883426 RepID=UPI00356447F5